MQRNFPGVSDDVKGTNAEEINSKKKFVKRKVKRYFSYEGNGDNQSNKTAEDNKSSINKGVRRDKRRTSNTNNLKEIVTIAKLKQWRFKGRENDGVITTVPIPKEKVMRYNRGEKIDIKGVRGKIHKRQLESKEQLIGFSNEQAARSELLLTEETGYLIADEGEETAEISQDEIAECVDITSAAKKFELQLREFGPYRMNYSRNGRFLLLGGYKGHLAAMDWVTKKLMCEINVMESIHDVRWLHTEAMYAVAQKSWTYIYDSQGIELHCLKQLHRVTRLDFLPYHFLLTACSDNGYLTWLDVSIGKIVANFYTRQGHLNIMAQNPQNALMCLGHAKGKQIKSFLA
ncbi:hypothetical protein J437_LFUL013344 [Ladona fulva]|uniref:WD repeat-containing protein 46 n=1 Tax=Ladona fulva TaxID=123851 RepID=A0A8K0KK31_LADFU|nr:hypothetical protein J437_LFUL013344 [Ladona fulva]